MTLALGDVETDSTLYIPWHTFNALGASVTITGLALTDIEIYKDGGTTPRDNETGYALLDTDGIDFAGKVGIHGISIDLSDDTDSGFFVERSHYWVVVSAITVDSQAISFVAATFTIKPKVWDEILTGATYNKATSAGRRLRTLSGQVLNDGTAQSATANAIVIESGAVTYNDQFVRAKIIITGGTGLGQECIITDSVASTDTLTITPAWTVTPDATSEYDILPAQAHSTVRNGGYDNGAVYVDTVNGVSGTQKGVNGTSTNPVDNLTDAYVIAGVEMLTTLQIEPGSALTLPSNSAGFKFIGSGYTVALNGQEIGNCTFSEAAQITGIGVDTLAENPPNFQLSGIGTVTLPPSTGFQCGFFGTLTIGSAGSFTFGGSASVFAGSFTIDYGAALNASTFDLQSWGGGQVEIKNAGAGTGTYTFNMNGTGHLVINVNCSATTAVDLHGNISLTNNASGITIDQSANITTTNTLQANVKEVNDIEVTGDGEVGTEWGPV